MEPLAYFAPKSLTQALSLLQKHEGQGKIVAGGTDLIVRMKKGLMSPRVLIDITGIRELRRIERDELGGVIVGATTCLSDIAENPMIRATCPMIADGVSVIGSVQVRNLGTIGGNICNASPAADSLPSLIALGGEIKIVSQEGTRWHDVEHFFVGPGQTVLKASEIVSEIRIPPLSPGTRSMYLKEGRVVGVDLAVVSVALALRMKNGGLCEHISIVLGAVAPTPIRVPTAESILRGREVSTDLIEKASHICAEASQPITDVRSSAEYRRRLVRVLVKRGLEKLCHKESDQG